MYVFIISLILVNVPALGESISEGSISSFEKAVGELVCCQSMKAHYLNKINIVPKGMLWMLMML